jgi:thiol-disulfide isomerase/thioredoxin
MPRPILLLIAGTVFLLPGACKRPEQSPKEGKLTVAPSLEEMEASLGEDPAPADSMPAPLKKAEEPENLSKPGDPGVPGFPFKRKIVDSNGRELDAEVLGKQEGKIAFLRLPDGKKFVLPLEKLSAADQGFFAAIPDGKAMVPVAEKSAHPQARNPVERKAEWLEDFEEAKIQASEQNLPMYVLFTGSSWCPPCKMLEKTVLRTDEFQAYADENLVLVIFDFPKGGGIHGKKERDQMKEKFGVRAFPTFFVTNPDGKILGGGQGFGSESPEAYIEKLADFVEIGKNQIPGIPSD